MEKGGGDMDVIKSAYQRRKVRMEKIQFSSLQVFLGFLYALFMMVWIKKVNEFQHFWLQTALLLLGMFFIVNAQSFFASAQQQDAHIHGVWRFVLFLLGVGIYYLLFHFV